MQDNEVKNGQDKNIDVEELIAKSKEGKLSMGEINEAVEEMDFDEEDKFYDAIEDT